MAGGALAAAGAAAGGGSGPALWGPRERPRAAGSEGLALWATRAAGSELGAATFAGGVFRDDRRGGDRRLGLRREGVPGSKQGRSLIVLPRRRQRAIDLRFDEDVVRPADHHEVLDIVAPHQHELPLPIEAERIHEAKPRLSGRRLPGTRSRWANANR